MVLRQSDEKHNSSCVGTVVWTGVLGPGLIHCGWLLLLTFSIFLAMILLALTAALSFSYCFACLHIN